MGMTSMTNKWVSNGYLKTSMTNKWVSKDKYDEQMGIKYDEQMGI